MTSRAKLIQLVHIGAAKAFDDEATRRAWQKARTGHDSCRDMTDGQLEALVRELRRKGALKKRPPKRAGRAPNTLDREPYLQKIEAQLADMGLSWKYAEAIAWRVTGGRGLKPNHGPGVKRLEWVRSGSDFRAIIAALAAEQEKRGLMAQITRALQALGRDLSWVDEQVPEKLRGHRWQRNRKWLRIVLNQLLNEEGRRAMENDQR